MTNKKTDNNRLPRIGAQLLKKLLPGRDADYLMGNYHEDYSTILSTKGTVVAWLWFWAQIIFSTPVYFAGRARWSMAMFKNYVTIALRNILKQKGYSFINLSGLGIGMACCILISFYVHDELSYDTFFENSDRIYRITHKTIDDGKVTHWACTSAGFAPALLSSVTGFENVGRITLFRASASMKRAEAIHSETGINFADQNFLDIFSFTFLHGDRSSALTETSTAVITRSAAVKYFGDEDPMGKIIRFNDMVNLTVTGVMEDLPHTTHFNINVLISWPTIYNVYGTFVDRSMTWKNFYIYGLLKESQEPQRTVEQFPAFLKTVYPDVTDRINELYLQPVTNIHLHSDLEKEIKANSDSTYVYIFTIVAVFILLIAFINFVNLTTARSSRRLREIGVRKVVGAHRIQVAFQFLSESVIMSFISMFIALIIVAAALPYYNSVSEKTVVLQDILGSDIVLLVALLALGTGVFAGIYPSLYLSRFKPAAVFKGLVFGAAKHDPLRKGLVVFQFAISTMLIISSVIVNNQLNFFRTKNLGFEKENIINVPFTNQIRRTISQKLQAFKDEALSHSGIVDIGLTSDSPGERVQYGGAHIVGRDDSAINNTVRQLFAGPGFISTMEIPVVEGRNFSASIASDSSGYIINRKAMESLSITNPLTTILDVNGNEGKIVGVIDDFHFASLHSRVEPLVLINEPEQSGSMMVKVKRESFDDAVGFLQTKISEFVPDQPFSYTVLENDLDALYAFEDKLSEIIGFFSFIAIFIGCLGLFGLASFTAERRSKEVAIRKVLGASTGKVVRLLTQEFVLLVFIANIVAWPTAYYFMSDWLQSFEYTITITPMPFLAASIAAFAIALITVSFQSAKAALANPVATLNRD